MDFIELSGAARAAAIDALGEAEPLIPFAHRATPLFTLSSPWAPGFHFCGARLSTAGPPGGDETMWFSLAGGGATPVAALTSCLGEAAERTSTVERPGDVAGRWTIAQARIWPAAASLIATLDVPDTESFDWCRAQAGKEDVLVPAAWCVRRAQPDRLAIPGAALSTGVAAGRSVEEAGLRAVLELVERDAAAHWWSGGRRGRALTLEAMGRVAALTALLRAGETHRRTWLLDITTDLDLPVVAAISTAPSGDGFAFGLGARTTRADAASAALIELCQMELAVQLAAARFSERGDESLTPHDRSTLRRAAAIHGETCDLLHPAGMPVGDGDRVDTLADVLAKLASHGVEVGLIDLTRDDDGVHVVRAIAPALQPCPGRIVTPRLAAVLEATGGTEHWTAGLDLM